MMLENVANNMGQKDATKAAVKGWINSTGHRTNMLRDTDICAVAVYEENG